MAKKEELTLTQKRVLAVIIGFAIISFWRGVWGLMDLYLFPTIPTLSFVLSICIGLGILFAFKHSAKGLM